MKQFCFTVDDNIRFFKELTERSGLSSLAVQTILKCVGISLITEFASDTCRDAGETSLAARVELFGRVASLIVAIPLFKEFIELIITLTEM